MANILKEYAAKVGQDYSSVQLEVTTGHGKREIEVRVYVNNYGYFSSSSFERALNMFLEKCNLPLVDAEPIEYVIG